MNWKFWKKKTVEDYQPEKGERWRYRRDGITKYKVD